MAFLLGLGLMTTTAMSSFKNNSSKVRTVDDPYTFVRVSGLPNSTNPADYEYRPAALCNESEEIITCSASWLEPTAPSIGDHPSGSYVTKLVNGEVELP